MRHAAKLTALAAAAGLLATACGGNANVLQGRTPTQVVQLASSNLTSSSYRMHLHGTLALDTSGLTGVSRAEIDQLSRMFKGLTVDGTAEVQDASTMRFTITLRPVLDKQLVLVVYGGHAYASQDGGRTFSDAGSLADALKGLPTSPAELKELLGDAVQTTDLGETTRNGNRVEHMHTTISPDYLGKLMSKLSGSGAEGSHLQGLVQFLQQVMTLQSGALDSYVRNADGRLDSVDGRLAIAIDVGKLMGVLENAFSGGTAGSLRGGRTATPSSLTGTMVLNVAVAARMYDYGASIHVGRPTVDPNAPKLPSGGVFGL